MKRIAALALAVLLPALLSAADKPEKTAAEPKHVHATKAIVAVHPASGSQVSGTVTFTAMDGTVEINGEITGLTPGEHAMHVHEFGDCSAPDAMSAGGHFNPDHQMHGRPTDEHRHVGDFGNITADASGKAVIKMSDKVIKLYGPHSIIGHALIIHAKPDDFRQPVGNAGGRVGCGVIGIAKP